MPFAVTDESTQDALDEVADGLTAFNEANSDVGDWHQKVFVARQAEGRFVGGVVVNLHWGWLHVDMLFVHDAFRRQGVGRRLLEAAEHYAKSRGCRGAYLDTLSFQAPGFYAKQGYIELATLGDFPPGDHYKAYLYKLF
jgi:GNAT superfamily N-acetyltransferase